MHLRIGFSILIVGLIAACNGPQDSQTAQGPRAPHPGATNYQEYCASCHGASCREFIQREWLYGNGWMEVYASIRDGYADDGMEAFYDTFTGQELTDITNYVMEAQEEEVFQYFKNTPRDLPKDWSTEKQDFQLETVVSDVEVPWGLAFLPDASMLVTERPGRLLRIDPKGGRHIIGGIPQVVDRGQGGLMDVELHPDYTVNGWIYLSYSKSHESDFLMSTTAVVRGRIEGDAWVDGVEVFEAQPYHRTHHHYGSRLKFDQEKSLWITVGERGKRDINPQDVSNDCGKVHRILSDGRPHPANPFYGSDGARETIYSYGHRNPQGLAVHPNGSVWEHEHGPRGGDELNLLAPGRNYGWPKITYGVNYNGNYITMDTERKGMEQPNYYWVPSIGPCGLGIVTSPNYPEWQGNFLIGSLSFRYLERVEVVDGEVTHRESLLPNIGRVREVEEGPDGFIYIAVEEPGAVYRLVPVN